MKGAYHLRRPQPNRRTSPCERLSQGWRLRRKQFRAVFGDMHIVFQAYSELAGDVDTRFIAKDHAGFELSFVSADQIRPFMTVHAHAVSHAMGEKRIVETVSSIADDFSGGSVHAFAWHP